MADEVSVPGRDDQPGSPGELRASHEDRDRVVEVLQAAAGDGRLTTEEFDERLGVALTARTHGELARVTTDLAAGPGPAGVGPAPEPKDVIRIDCRSGSTKRDGRWVVPRRIEVKVTSGLVVLDFTQAVISYPTLQVDADVSSGSLALVTKPGIMVDTDDVAIRSGTVRVRPPGPPEVPVTLRIDVSGRVGSGIISARPPRLPWPAVPARSTVLSTRAARRRRPGLWVVILVALASVLILVAKASMSLGGTPGSGERRFLYGFDFAQQGPYVLRGPDAPAVRAAHHVLSSIPGMLEDTPIMGWGLPDPEPSPGRFDLAGIASRIRLITSTGGTPVVTLCAAPQWMTNSTSPIAAPAPAHYQDFAALAAKIAESFPQVKYFVVWNEFKGFWSDQSANWDIRDYTVMYNDVYAAIKRARPDALVGGPYAPTTPFARPKHGNLPSTLHGAWGYMYQGTLDAIRYWLANKAGADFIAVDGPDFPRTGPVTDPLTATQKFADTDHWLRRLTSLPIWWMESPVQPAGSGWSPDRAAAIRVAALVQLASSGARAGLQWQPQQGEGVPDEGLWTAAEFPAGGQPTRLAQLLPQVLAVLRYRVAVVPGQRFGVLAATGPGGSIAINTNAVSSAAHLNGTSVALGPGQVRVSQ